MPSLEACTAIVILAAWCMASVSGRASTGAGGGGGGAGKSSSGGGGSGSSSSSGSGSRTRSVYAPSGNLYSGSLGYRYYPVYGVGSYSTGHGVNYAHNDSNYINYVALNYTGAYPLLSAVSRQLLLSSHFPQRKCPCLTFMTAGGTSENCSVISDLTNMTDNTFLPIVPVLLFKNFSSFSDLSLTVSNLSSGVWDVGDCSLTTLGLGTSSGAGCLRFNKSLVAYVLILACCCLGTDFFLLEGS